MSSLQPRCPPLGQPPLRLTVNAGNLTQGASTTALSRFAGTGTIKATDQAAVSSTIVVNPEVMGLPDGSVASGDVDLEVAFWSPMGDLNTAPPLLFDPNSGNPDVRTWGIAQIEFRQAGITLQVVPGSLLGWELNLPAAVAPKVAALAPADLPRPYYFNTSNALWEAYGSATYDATRGVIVGLLPHLTDTCEGSTTPTCEQLGTCPPPPPPPKPDPCSLATALKEGDACIPGDLEHPCCGLPECSSTARTICAYPLQTPQIPALLTKATYPTL